MPTFSHIRFPVTKPLIELYSSADRPTALISHRSVLLTSIRVRSMTEVRYFMDDKLYKAAAGLQGTDILSSIDDELFLNRLTPGNENNILHIAAKSGNHEFIWAVLARPPAVSYELLCKHNFKGETPLHLAAQFGHLETVKSLLEAHDMDELSASDQKKPCWVETDKHGDTPLHKALRFGHQDIALLLLKRDVKRLVSLNNNVGESAAYLAAENLCPHFLHTILDADRNHQCSVSFSGPFGRTTFHAAAINFINEDIMSLLIERRIHLLKVQDNNEKTALHYVVVEKKESMAKTLLKAESSLAYFHDKDGLTPLHIAASMGYMPMIQSILELSPQSLEIRDKLHARTSLHFAKMESSFLRGCLQKTTMKELINEVDNDGNTILHLALMNSDIQSANVLLQVRGINWRLKNKQGQSPMDLCKSDDQEIPIKLKYLASASWSAKESVNMKIFYHKQVTKVDDLLNHYKSWEEFSTFQGPGGNNIFHLAAKEGRNKIIEELAGKSRIARHLLVSGRNFKGETPLHLAAEHGHLQVVKAIQSLSYSQTSTLAVANSSHSPKEIENGHANDQIVELKPWTMVSMNGDTPVHKAIRNRHAKIAVLLLRLEPDLASVTNNANESLLYLAADQCCSPVVNEILSKSRGYPFSINGPDGKNPLHAAVEMKTGYSYSIGSYLINRQPELVSMVDNDNKTPLHYAVETVGRCLLRKLIKQDKSTAFAYDNEGFTPLLRAVSSGSYTCMDAILDHCPLSAELRDVSNNKTALHLIAPGISIYGLQRIVYHKNMLKMINETDTDGNTPLHTAILDADKNRVFVLLKAKGVNWRIKNKQHQMPLDLCKQLIRNGCDCENQREIYKVLGGLVRGVLFPTDWIRSRVGLMVNGYNDVMAMRKEELKQLMNNMALVATLLVTLSFAALFTIPGGYDQTHGKPLRMKELAIQMLVICDALAMLLGIAVLLGYLYALSTGHRVFLRHITSSSVLMLQGSLVATLVAFLCGLYAIVSPTAIWILILSIIVALGVAFFNISYDMIMR